MSAYLTLAPLRSRRARLLAGCALAAAATAPAAAQTAFKADIVSTQGGVDPRITETIGPGQLRDRVGITSKQAVIDWALQNESGTGSISVLSAGNELRLESGYGSSGVFTVLNRIVPTDQSRAIAFDGTVSSRIATTPFGPNDTTGGNIWFYSPGGIIAGANSVFDVGSLVLSTNDIPFGNFDTEGLFAGNDIDATSGTIRFRGSPDSRSAITIEAGAKINAASSYVALVAPRVAQRGAITVNGSVALIAAESADVTIPMAGNLFDIAVFSGSNVAAKGDITLDHSGSTQIADAANIGDARRIYMVAVPKNDAITMLVSGTAGYEAASQVQAVNGKINLLAQTDVSITGDTPASGPGFSADVEVAALTANTDVFAFATSFDLDATAASTTLTRGLVASTGASNDVTVANGFSVDIGQDSGSGATFFTTPTTVNVSSGGSLKVVGNLLMFSSLGGGMAPSVGSDLSLGIDNAKVEIGGSLSMQTSRAGGAGNPGGTATGGNVTIAVSNAGLLKVGGDLIGSSKATGGSSTSVPGGAGFGGSVDVTVTGGGQLIAEAMQLTSSGLGGVGQIGGLGQGGTVAVSADAGTITTSSIKIDAGGTGSDNPLPGGTAGDGTGGIIILAALNTGTISTGVVDLLANGTSGLESGYGVVAGTGTGGQISVQAIGGGLIDMTGLTGNAVGGGRFGSQSGGAGFGGRITFEAAGGAISASEGVSLAAKGAGGSSNADGGSAIGGKISIAASAGTIDVGNFTGDASATGGSSFGFGSGGGADGGEIKISALAGGTILGLNFFEATGEAGDGDSDATAGFGTGGSIIVRAADGIIDARGGTLSLVANGVGGNGQPITSFVGDTLLARGGTVDIGLTGTGQLLYSSIQALANARFLNFADGFVSPNHGANAVGGTVLLSAADASLVQGDSVEASISLTANGTGAFSAAGGFGGTGYQGRAEVRITGGTVDVPFLSVTARAQGGLGNDQNEEGGDDAGSGGFAGIGVSPYSGEAGAIVDITGGTLTADFISVDGGSAAGAGGEGEEFANLTLAGRGGDAIGGVARFSVTEAGSVNAFGLSVFSDGRGGDGGSVEIFDSGSSDGIMGDGGFGAGGFVSVTLGGTGTLSIGDLDIDALGNGGDGGSFDTGYGGFFGGTGRGGTGGLAFGGTTDVKVSTSLGSDASILLAASGTGGDGGNGPQGGSGGEASGGLASLSFLGGTHTLSDLQIGAGAFGGFGGSGQGGDGGDGGKATGLKADLTIGAGAIVTTDRVIVLANGLGGGGGSGASEFSAGFNGGNGGNAAGGSASVALNGGSLTLLGFAEGPPGFVLANADGGFGGFGGDASQGAAGSGGDGGSARGGSATFATVDGTADLFSLQVRASGAAGSGGLAGFGTEGIDGDAGTAQGGAATLLIDQKNAPGNLMRLGAVDLATDGTAGGFSAGKAGSVSIAAFGGATPLMVELQSLEITSFGTEDPGDAAGLSFAGTNATLAVAFNADMRINGAVVATGKNTLNANGQLLINAGGSIDLGSTSFGASDVTIDSFGSNLTSNGTIFSVNNLSVQAVLGDASLANLKAGSVANVTAAGSVTIGNVMAQDFQAQAGADGSPGRDLQLFGQIDAADQINVQATRDILLAGAADVRGGGGVFMTAGDDIIIGAGALLRSDSGPPPEFGYGGPLLSLRAGFGGFAQELPPGDIGSIIVDGGIDFGNGTAVLEADAIAGNRDTGSVTAGNLYASLTDIPPTEVFPSNDLGQLSGRCLQGSICLGGVSVSGLLQINEGSEAPLPNYVRFDPRTDAAVVDVRALAIDLGRDGITTSLKASQFLDIVAVNGSLTLADGLSITSGGSFTRLAASNNINGKANVSAVGTLDLFGGNNISFGALQAGTIRTVDIDSEQTVINASGITASGKISIGKLSYAKDVSLLAGTGVSLDLADLGAGTTLSLFTKAGVARLGGGVADDVSVSGDAVDIAVNATGDVVGTAANGDATLGTVAGASIDVAASQKIVFSNLSSAGLVRLDAKDAITGGSATGGDVSISTAGTLTADVLSAADTLDVNATAGISVGATNSGGATSLLAATGGVSVKTDAFAGGGIVAEGTGVSLIGKNGLIVTSAKSTAGELILVAGGSTLKVGTANVAGDAILFSGGDMTVESLTTTGKASLESALGSVQVASVDAQGSTSASGTSVSLASSGALKVTEAEATSGTLVLRAGGDLIADRIASSGTATLTAGGGVQVLTDAATTGGLTAAGTTVMVAGLNGLTITKATASAGDIKLTNVAGAVAVTLADTSNVLSIDSGGSVTVSDVTAPGGVKATGTAVTLTGNNGLFVQQATATSGDVKLASATGALTLGSITATGDVQTASASTLSFSQLKAGGLLSLTGKGDVTGTGQVRGESISVQTPGRFELLLDASSSSGPLSISADQGIRAFQLASSNGMTLTAANGSVSIERVIGPDVVASGKAVALGSVSVLDVKQAIATAGDVNLGAIVINADAVNASGAVNLIADGSIKADALSGNTVFVEALSGDVAFNTVDADTGAGIFATGAVLGGSVVAGSLKMNGKIGVSLSGSSKVQGDVSINSGADVTFADGAALTSTEGTIVLTALGKIVGEGVSLFAAKDLTIAGTKGVTLGSAAAGGLVELTASADMVSVTKNLAGGLVRVSGQSVALTGQNGLDIDAVTSTGDITLTATSGALKVVKADADGGLVLTSSEGVTFTSLSADKALFISAQTDVTGGSATAASIAITTLGALVADDLVATDGTLAAVASNGVTVDTAVSSGTTTLKADQGVVTVTSDIKPGQGLIVSAPSISLTGQTGLNISEANATAGDLVLKTVTGDLIAGKSTATGAISLDSAGALTFASLTAQQGVTLKAAADVGSGSVAGTSVTVTAGGTNGIALQSIAASGPVTLGATVGAIQIGNVLTPAAIQATARSIGLGSAGNILLSQASATAGDIALKADGGITLGQVSASKALNAASGSTLTVSGAANAATIGFTSADIAIGSGAQIGSVSQTGTITFTSTAPRTFVGGTGTGTGYRLDATELTRVAARDGIAITAPPTQTSTAFTFVDPDQATIVLDSMTFTGAQLGTNGIFTVDAPRSIGIVGNVQYANFAAGQSVIYRAGSDISLGAETGLVTLKDSAGALAGTLRLQAPQVIAMSVPARREIPDLTLNQAAQRLGTNDAVQNDGGYFQAGNIDVRIGRLLFVQNSGANGSDIDATRGFTGNSVRIEATGTTPAQVVLAGRVQTGNGFAVGDELADNITLVGSFDPNSSFGGCAVNASTCGALPEEVTNVTFSVARDQIRDEEEEDEQEEAIQASQTRPDPVIQFMTTPSSRFDPLIDEPITGAGNEDLWEAPTVPSPGLER